MPPKSRSPVVAESSETTRRAGSGRLTRSSKRRLEDADSVSTGKKKRQKTGGAGPAVAALGLSDPSYPGKKKKKGQNSGGAGAPGLSGHEKDKAAEAAAGSALGELKKDKAAEAAGVEKTVAEAAGVEKTVAEAEAEAEAAGVDKTVAVAEAEAAGLDKTVATAVSEGGEKDWPMPPPRRRYPPYPTSGSYSDKKKWQEEVAEMNEHAASLDPAVNPLTLRKEPHDPDTAAAVVRTDHKAVVIEAAKSVVMITTNKYDGTEIMQCSGIVIGYDHSTKTAAILTTSLAFCDKSDVVLVPNPKITVSLHNKTTVEGGQLRFHYQRHHIALLEITTNIPLKPISSGVNPFYGQELFILGREESRLTVRKGTVLWLEPVDIWCFHNLLMDCDLDVWGMGGLVIDMCGVVAGMAFTGLQYPSILAVSVIMKCLDMWKTFGYIFRPDFGMSLHTVEMMDVSRREEIFNEYNISSGLITYEIKQGGAAESVGILPGDIVLSINDCCPITLTELEDLLLSIGWDFQFDTGLARTVKLVVYDPVRNDKRTVMVSV